MPLMNFVNFFGSKEMYSQLKEHRRNADLKEVSSGVAKAHLVPFLGSTSTIRLLVGWFQANNNSRWILNLAGPISCVFSIRSFFQPNLPSMRLAKDKNRPIVLLLHFSSGEGGA